MGDFNKMAQAKASAKSFLAGVQPGEEVALIAFFDCGDIRLLKGFTRDPASLIPAIDSLAPSGSTPLAASIRFAGRYMCQAATAPEGQIIVLTDGGENCGGNPVEAAKSVFSRIRRFDRKDCPGGTVMRPAPQPGAMALQEPRPGTWRVLADHLICRLSGVAHAQTITATPTITTTGTVTGVLGNDTVTIIGFGVDSDTAKTLQEAAQAGGGTYYDAQDQQSLTQALRQAGGQVVAPGDANGDGRCTGAEDGGGSPGPGCRQDGCQRRWTGHRGRRPPDPEVGSSRRPVRRRCAGAANPLVGFAEAPTGQRVFGTGTSIKPMHSPSLNGR